jgi:hypothetical protein
MHLVHVLRLWSLLFAIWLPLQAAQSDPAILQIRIVEGEGLVYTAGSRATRGITVQVTDETGKPVEGASVSFRLPDEGPSGAFSTGSKSEIATTRPDGRASIWGMQWNRTVGSMEVRITAVKGQARAGTVCSSYISEPAAGVNSKDSRVGGGSSHKWVWILLAAGGAVGAGAAVALGKSNSSTTTSVPAPSIGAPTVTLGHP